MENKMEEIDKEQLKLEVSHIFDSGANKIRIIEMVERFINRRYLALGKLDGTRCICKSDETTGSIQVLCCNICGKPNEDWFCK
jgi:hypothetical protein